MPRIVLDFDPEQPDAPQFHHDTADLVYFLSMAFAARFGASHELAEASLVLKNTHKVDMPPLIRYADREIEEPSDESLLENAWQGAAPLAASARQAVQALTSDDEAL